LNFKETVRSYVEVTKPPIVLLLVFTSIATMLVALSSTPAIFSLATLLIASVSITSACAGCDVLTCYIDRDIDAVMHRTRNRPIPSGRISPNRALAWGLLLTGMSLALAFYLNVLSFVWILLGVLDNVVVYSLVLKRRNPLNIILGGISGGLPVMFGWSAMTGSAALLPTLLAALVVLWIPGHIWSLAIFSKDDYARANVPMLPVVVDLKSALRCIVSTVVLMVPFTFAIYWAGNFGPLYLIAAAATGAIVLVVNLRLFVRPNEKSAWRAFKISSPYLFIIFLAMILDRLML
jgi:protoheme IX farnesyltransferase